MTTEINSQILFTKNEAMFVGRVVKETEKAVKVDFVWEGIWSPISLTVYTNTTWIPKSALTLDETNDLTVKPWYKNVGLKKENIFPIKRYYVEGDEQIVRYV